MHLSLTCNLRSVGEFSHLKDDDFVKCRLTGENRCPVFLYLPKITGFRLSLAAQALGAAGRNDDHQPFSTFYEFIKDEWMVIETGVLCSSEESSLLLC